jgi:pseudaminic acid cytidylyltransferase
MNVAVIPARGGSKRIPRKNIKEFCGKPMIAWPIEVAKKSGLFEHILVSTDDEEISKVSKSCGAEVSFMRPADLSDDYTGTTEVIAHSVSWMQDKGWTLDAICCIYPTSVFLQIEHLKQGWDAIASRKWKFAFSVTDYEYPIFRSFKMLDHGGVEMFFPEHFETRSQDLPKALHDAAQFYWGTPKAWLNQLKVFDCHSFPVIIPHWQVQDIDTDNDWKRAELIFKMISKSL